MSTDRNDIDLIDQLKNDNSIAFDSIFNKYSNRLYAFSLRYLKSESEAEELVHNVFVKVWEKRKTIKKEASIKAFLFTVAYNDILKHFRKQNYHQLYLSNIVENNSNELSERLEYASILEYIDELIDQLPERKKQIFLKSRMEGKSAKEIAEELNLSPGTIDNIVSETIKFIKERVNKESIALLLFIALFL
ncbi:RNA polymerase sigma factor [Carboxylicivirga linearis]|uniref:RNA polymerase sigma-70 factor n=1 Tax=Carboxylicivirga linearis TaxID=1628157 RepID=A0ABS5JWX4_9BACT|nr:RNA polymerase sigma-70 factor [Carboxylicivirga linearis]MBS2099382.1 RNA polymerase sigma-70 factor [Carboxylicivirga linearis]